MQKLLLLLIPLLLFSSCFKEKDLVKRENVRYKIDGAQLIYAEEEIKSFRENIDNTWIIECTKPGPQVWSEYKIEFRIHFGAHDPKDYIGQYLKIYSDMSNALNEPSIDIHVTNIINSDSPEDIYIKYLQTSAILFKITDISENRITANFEGELNIPICENKPQDEDHATLIVDGFIENVLIPM